MPISNNITIDGIGSVDLSPLDARLDSLEQQVANLQPSETRPWLIKTESYQALSGDRIVANGNTAGFTVTLPSNPVIGESIQILVLGTNAIAVDPAGANLNGAIAPLIISTDRQETHFIYVGAAGWVAAVSGGAGSGGGSTPTPTPTSSALTEIKKIAGWQILLMSDVGVNVSGGAVAVWLDQSENANDASMGDQSKQPLLASNALPSQKPALFFSSSQLLYAPIAATAKTIFLVARFATSSDSDNYLLGHLPGSTPTQLLGYDDDNAGLRMFSSGGGYFGGLKRPEILNQWKIFEIVIDINRVATLYINGVIQPGSVTLAADFTGGLIGGYGGSDPRSLEGNIAAILENGTLTSAQRSSVRQQLASWAGITL